MIKSFLLYILSKYHIILSLVFEDLSDKKSFFKHLEKASKLGNSWAQNNLGCCYISGYMVQKNHIEAAQWFQKAAIQGNKWGQANLGTAYYEGRGIEQNFELAIFWYKKAATQNHPEIQYNLALMYFDGIGVQKNPEKAIQWLNKSSKLGIIEAREVLEKINTVPNENLNLPHLSISDDINK